MRYAADGVPLIVIAGKEYGSGSSRDWAAKGPRLLGVKAVIAESFERIHRTNLVGMGILPLQFLPGESAASLGLTGREAYTIALPAGGPAPRSRVTVSARADDGGELRFEATVRLDGPIEIDYYRQGGILPAVLRRIVKETRTAARSRDRPRLVTPDASCVAGSVAAYWLQLVGRRSQRCLRSSARSSGGSGPASLTAVFASTFSVLRIPGMTVPTSGFERMNRRAISAMVMPGGTSGFRASARATDEIRFSETK